MLLSTRLLELERVEMLKLITDFLDREGIKYSYACINNKLGKGVRLQIRKHESCKKFCESIYDKLVIKKPQHKTALIALYLKEALPYGYISKDLYLFDILRHKLPEYAKKGPKVLKPWTEL